jgi:hypothetical protein
MFAEDVDLLLGKMFGPMLDGAARSPAEFEDLASSLFTAMKAGGKIGFERVDWSMGIRLKPRCTPAKCIGSRRPC